MVTFNLEIFEDQLLNRDELINLLDTVPADTHIQLNTQGEGPSLNYCGLVDLLINSGRDLSTISVLTPNVIESLPIQCIGPKHKFSFWFRSVHQAVRRYTFTQNLGQHYRLGCFIGRKNLDRLAILYWLSRRYTFFLSSLREDQIHYEHRPDLESWVDNRYSFESWVRNFNIPSIDDYSVTDQYKTRDMFQENTEFLQVQTNMLNYYNRFDVELVCETFVRGDTYFPTEKTVRPIAGSKPMLVYGPRHYLKRLRDQGFKTWASCWDESYDDYEGLERWERMKAVINQINAWGDWEWKTILEQANMIARENFEFFDSEIIHDY